MMTKEEIVYIVLYCKDNNVSFKDRLKELGITPKMLQSYRIRTKSYKIESTCIKFFRVE